MIPDQESVAYDQVAYPGHAFGHSHPDRLATVASLYGMTPAPVPCCRVLELGCGDGGNLIPLAYQWPDSSFLGIDRSVRAIETGSGALAELGLRNIELRHLDIMDVTADLGRFDYIIAHGVYSWVPPIVRAKILDIFRTSLAPRGVAYLSYNCYPGAYLTDLARGMMLYHVRDRLDPREKIDQSRALLAFLAEASPDNEIYGLILRRQLARVLAKTDAVFFHDDLEEAASPCFLHQVVEDATRHGLQYLADATTSVVEPRMHPSPVANMLEHIPVGDIATREQYLDFIGGRGFRRTLLCHGDVALTRSIHPTCIANYHLAGRIDLPSGTVDPLAEQPIDFSTSAGTLSADHRLSKAALLYLGEIWPRTASFDDLVEQALGRLAHAAAPIMQRRGEELETLATVLFRAFAASHVNLHLHPPRLTTRVGVRPEASAVARQQVRAKRSTVTNLCHGTVSLEDDIVRRFLVLVDGTRTVDQLVADLDQALATEEQTGREAGGDGNSRSAITRESVERNLTMLAKLGLLVA